MRFLTIFTGTETVHLYKDVGGIPYALAKYHNYDCSLAYDARNSMEDNDEYKQYVSLIPIESDGTFISRLFNYGKFIVLHAKEFDCINVYHGGKLTAMLCLLAKMVNKDIVRYVKLDMSKKSLNNVCNFKKEKNKIWNAIVEFVMKYAFDFYTVETRDYVGKLNSLKRYGGRVKYLPNGVFCDIFRSSKNVAKENIILAVGQLGTEPKNTELLIEAIIDMGFEKIKSWKVYLVGGQTDEFADYLKDKRKQHPFLNDILIETGNINDKVKLNYIYAKAKIFVSPSRWESYGIVNVEALSFGCYCVLTDCCDAYRDYIDDECGCLVPNEDKKALADCLTKKIQESNFINSESIAKHAKERLDWKAVSGMLKEYLEGCKV